MRPRLVIDTLFLLVTAVTGTSAVSCACGAHPSRKSGANAELQTLNAQLEAQLLEYDNDEVIERIAREQLRLVTPGERPVIVIEAPAEDNADR